MLKTLQIFIVFTLLLFPVHSNAQLCGFKPHAQFGCKIGRCVNGKWEQVCGESNTELNSEAINSAIANPKMADIAGALETRKRRLDAEAERKQQTSISEKTSTVQSQLMGFEELRKTDNASATAVIAGIGQGFSTANAMLQMNNRAPLYCQHKNVGLGAENYMQIYESMLERHADKLTSLESATVAQVLLLALVETFPCQNPQ